MNDEERKAALSASRSMRDRAARAARKAGKLSYHWLAGRIATNIEALPLISDDDVGTVSERSIGPKSRKTKRVRYSPPTEETTMSGANPQKQNPEQPQKAEEGKKARPVSYGVGLHDCTFAYPGQDDFVAAGKNVIARLTGDTTAAGRCAT